ncbi:MAG: serine/threonine-protein kinase [Gammaproteobacteria bacterium]|nr:serine/threonine-protein kinase [Gammaproteobacteria bacterium]MCW5584223.1 serine/threonine-protein kinase [Gammaproteobacteria bacterium]
MFRNLPLSIAKISTVNNKTLSYDDKVIGEGSNAFVFSGQYDGKPVAIKVSKPKDKESIKKEQTVLEKITAIKKNPNDGSNYLTQYYGADYSTANKRPAYIGLILEFADKGSLDDVINDKNDAQKTSFEEWGVRYRFALHIATGIEFLHRNNIIHCDIKPANILIRSNAEGESEALIGDFGYALTNGSKSFLPPAGSALYFSPECLNGKFNTKESDIFSLGVTFFEMAARRPIYYYVTQTDFDVLYTHVVVTNKKRDVIPSDPLCPPIFASWIKRCWEHLPKDRPTSDQLLDAMKARKPMNPIETTETNIDDIAPRKRTNSI